MSIMVNKQTCAETINRFVGTKDLNDLILLITYLCEIKEVSNADEVINLLFNTGFPFSFLIPPTLEYLEKHFGLIRVSDRNNNIILVF